MKDESKISFLKDEYLLLQRFYEDFDGRVMTIKGWSATVAIAAIGVGFYQTEYLWLFAAAASLIFWLLETTWKSFQYMYAPRIEAIEEAFRNDDFSEIAPFQIYTSWFEVFTENGFQLFQNFRLPIVFFPHLITFVTGILLFTLKTLGLITIAKS